MTAYVLLSIKQKGGSCKSHRDRGLPFSYFLGNSNWTKSEEGLITVFTCMQCGEERIFERKTETTLL